MRVLMFKILFQNMVKTNLELPCQFKEKSCTPLRIYSKKNQKMNRQTFLKQALGLGALTVLNPLTFANNIQTQNDTLFIRVVNANNKAVDGLIKTLSQDITVLKRDLGFDYANLAAAFCTPESPHFQNAALVPLMEKIMSFLLKEQKADGTLDIGNVESPPDTAFILEPICAATLFLNKNPTNILRGIKDLAKKFILHAGDALTLGGIHTPNHRWVVSAALAQINALFPNPKYIKRIDEWFSENLFIDSEGHYLERSMIYAQVIDRSLITLSRLLNKPELLDAVRKNLEMVLFYLEPNGELVTTDSRRQDQFMIKNALPFYLDYWYMAILDKNERFAGMAQFIENMPNFDDTVLSQSLFCFLDEPLLKDKMLVTTSLSTNYERFFKETNLVRFRKNKTTATIFGGADFPIIVGSGRSTSPNFFAFRKGEAILKHLRLSADFFSTGYFRSEGIKKEDEKYVLYEKREVPYYQPLPYKAKRKDGDYKLSQSLDRRFWNKMDFENRPLSNVKVLETKITVSEKNGVFTLDFDIYGTDNINITLELCFKEGGKLPPMTAFDDQPDNYYLENGIGTYTVGNDIITFGQGLFTHNKVKNIDGEIYTSHFGTLRTQGVHVYITGKTPFKHTLTLT